MFGKNDRWWNMTCVGIWATDEEIAEMAPALLVVLAVFLLVVFLIGGCPSEKKDVPDSAPPVAEQVKQAI